MKLALRSVHSALTAGLVVVAGLGSARIARAQTDSALAITKAGATLLRLNTDGSLFVGGALNVGTIPISGAGVRMMWFPSRAAFRAGSVGGNQWDLASIGNSSVAFGSSSVASGDQSTALGLNAAASGTRSFAFNGVASGDGAFAAGSGAQATGDDALALGPSSNASGLASVAIGASTASGSFGVAIGLQNSATGNFSVAIGKNARTANRQGTVVLGDGCAGFSSDSVYPSANNQFVARGCGGIRFFTSQNLSSGVEVAAGGGSWSSISDSTRKANFRPIDGEALLHKLTAIPVTTWNYKTQATDIRHMGPMAQDLYSAFGLGESDRLINTVDIDGVNLAAAQALTMRTDSLRARVESLSKENASLKDALGDLTARLDALEAKLGASSSGAAPSGVPKR